MIDDGMEKRVLYRHFQAFRNTNMTAVQMYEVRTLASFSVRSWNFVSWQTYEKYASFIGVKPYRKMKNNMVIGYNIKDTDLWIPKSWYSTEYVQEAK
jgi:hypothetical protein